MKRAFSLLEVILALAILAGSIAAIGEVMRSSLRAAGESRDLTQAQLLCESKMAEVVVGIEPLEPILGVAFELEPQWLYSVDILPLESGELLAVMVTVEQDPERVSRPARFSLVRWVSDITTIVEEIVEPEELDDSEEQLP